MHQQHVVVVGGGLIGLSTACALLRDGHRVTIVERDRLGSGAATGNAGEITPQQVAPLASANTVKDLFRGVFSPSSYLSIPLQRLIPLAGFGLGFLRSATPARQARGSAALAQFSEQVFPALDRLAADGVDISGGNEGFLMTCSDETELLTAHAGYVRRADAGWGRAPGPILRGAALAEHEPALRSSVRGGFELPGEFSLDPVSFVASLARVVEAAGAAVLTGLAAQRLGEGASVICADESGTEVTVAGDRVVVAAGAWTTPILRRSGIRSTRVVAGKGYSFTVPVERMPRGVIHALDLHCVAIPMHGRLRIVGLMDFDARPERLRARRIAVLTGAAAGLVAGADWEHRSEEWVGARPMTADGMPLLGPVPGRPEVLVAAGHNMHGLSLGPVTGEAVADLVAGRPVGVRGGGPDGTAGREIDISPFAVRR